MANKAEVEGYCEAPFFKKAPGEHADWVAWAGGAEEQKSIFWSLIELIGDKIDYLLKEGIGQHKGGMTWRRVFGGIYPKDLAAAIDTDSELFFHDSGFQFCARSAETGDYFAYDEHGIFWIYSKNPQYCAKLREAELEERDAQLICDSAHWHVRPKDAEKRLERFISMLRENSQFSEQEEAE